MGPMIFNIRVSDLQEVAPPSMECVQYADDTSLCSHFNVKELDSRAVDMNETLASITNWSQDSIQQQQQQQQQQQLYFAFEWFTYIIDTARK